MTRKIAYLGVMLAAMITLSFVEHSLPPVPVLPPGAGLGLANIISMYCVFFLGAKEAYALNALKSGFAALTRGFVAGGMSLAGGLLSVTVMLILSRVFKDKLSYSAASVCGAIAHNMGQLLVSAFLTGTALALWYFPALLVSGLIFGFVTAAALNALLPALKRIMRQ